jgi:predicted site-specific integrase-resolvase
MSVTPKLASVARAAKIAGISRSLAYCWARMGCLPGAVRIGSRWYVRCSVLERWLEGRETPSDMPDEGRVDEEDTFDAPRP